MNITDTLVTDNCANITNLISILSLAIPLIVSEILALSHCETNGIIDGCIKLCKRYNGCKR